MILKTQIYVTTNFIGFHRWPDAPEAVSFLRDLHRHVFGVRVVCDVSHLDRQVEFILLKKQVDQDIHTNLSYDLAKNPAISCETMASKLLHLLRGRDFSIVSVEVNEDGENGAIVTVPEKI